MMRTIDWDGTPYRNPLDIEIFILKARITYWNWAQTFGAFKALLGTYLRLTDDQIWKVQHGEEVGDCRLPFQLPNSDRP